MKIQKKKKEKKYLLTVNPLPANPHQIKFLEVYPGIGGSDPNDKAVEYEIINLIDHI